MAVHISTMSNGICPATPGPASGSPVTRVPRNLLAVRSGLLEDSETNSMRPPSRPHRRKFGHRRKVASPQGKRLQVELSPDSRATQHPTPIGGISPRAAFVPSLGPRRRARGQITDGWSNRRPPAQGRSVQRPRHLGCRGSIVLFSNTEGWALGTFHGLRRAHLRRYLDEFVFRWNRRGFRHPARHRHAPATRRLPRHRRTTRLIPAGRAPATARPPIRLNRSRMSSLPAALETNFLVQKLPHGSPGGASENRAWNG